MLNLDLYVDALEDAIASRGVLAIHLQQYAPVADAQVNASERTSILIEMLRVWMEHRCRSGNPVSVQDCLKEFPSETFSDEQLNNLRFEEERLRHSFINSSCSSTPYRSLEELPQIGEMWGEFELLELLGVGAFAKVYLAKQHGLSGRFVALKLTFRQNSESQWLATLQHSAIVPIYSTHALGDVYAICMPFLGNTTLADLLQAMARSPSTIHKHWWSLSRHEPKTGGQALLSTIQQRHRKIETLVDTTTSSRMGGNVATDDSSVATLSHHRNDASNNLSASSHLLKYDQIKAICWIGLQLADALAYAHRNGVVHSDVKPANVLMAFDGQPRLLDFNVAYQTADGTDRAGQPLGGTFAYMSPEHRHSFENSAIVDGRSDLYSLGVVLYELLTDRLPETRDQKSSDPTKWNSAVSPAMSAIVMKCLELDPKSRYQSADDLRDDLTAQFLNKPLIHQREPSSVERFLKWCYRHPSLSSSITVGSVFGLVVLFLLFGLYARQVALDQAHWDRRLDLLEQRVPDSMVMLTSLDAFPELESEVVSDLEETFSLIAKDSKSPNRLDSRWTINQAIGETLRSDVRQLAWIASQRSWKQSPSFPEDLDLSNVDKEENKRLNPIRLRKEGDFASAIKVLKLQVEDNPQDYVGWWLLGDSYLANQDLANSMQAYSACVALNPKSALPYLNRGMTRFAAAMYGDAAEDYQKCLRLSPSWYWCHLNRALALQMLGRLDEAIAELNTATSQGYETVSIYRLRGELNAAKGELEKAQNDYQRALQCEPITDQHWVDRGLIMLASSPAQAAEAFENALKLKPKSLDAHQKLAYVYSELLAKPDKSLEHSNKLVELAPTAQTHLAGRAVLHARAGRAKDALADLVQLDQLVPKDPMVMYQMACAYSLVAASATTKENVQPGVSAWSWFSRAVQVDSSLFALATTDPDVQWLRGQPRFHEMGGALRSLQAGQQ